MRFIFAVNGDEEIVTSGGHEQVADLREFANFFGDVFSFSCLDDHADQGGGLQADVAWIGDPDDLQHLAIHQPFNAASDGTLRDAQLAGDLGVGHATIVLQIGDYGAVSCVCSFNLKPL